MGLVIIIPQRIPSQVSTITVHLNMSYDQEKIIGETKKQDSFDTNGIEESSSANGSVEEGKLSFLNKMARALNGETKGIELITDEEKTDDSVMNAASMWWSANMVIATFADGALAIPAFGLSFWQATFTIIFFSILGVFPVALFSVFGPKLGLRQMVLSKFLLGDLCMRLFAIINMIACVGWGAVNIMSSAQLLHIVNNGACPPWAGCLILVICTIIVTFFGYNVIHAYEKWSWIPNAVCFIAIIARMAMAGTFTSNAPNSHEPFPGGPVAAGDVLSYGSLVYGFSTGWTTYAADYTVYQPRNANAWKIFCGVFIGVYIPVVFTMILGAACATGISTNTRWSDLYNSDSIGGLVYAILVEDSLHGFGEFLCVILALSTVANNIPNMYTIALSAQATWSPFSKVPRVFWTIVGNFVTLAICIPGYYSFSSVMTNFMSCIGYYLSIYQGISLTEHYFFRRGDFSTYEYERIDDKNAYPVGLAGLFGFCCGVVGVVLGMNQTWYTGVIGSKIGNGGDIAWELGLSFGAIGYLISRPIEKKYLR